MLKQLGLHLLVLVLCVFQYTIQQGTIESSVQSHLTGADLIRLEKVFIDATSSNDLQSIYYSVLNYEKISDLEKQNVCGRLQRLHTETKLNDFEKNFYLVGTYKHLKCTFPISDTILKQISQAFEKDLPTAQEIFFNLFSSKAMNVKLDAAVTDRIVKNLQNILRKDDSLSSLGYAFFISSELGAPAAFVADRIEDAIVQADEVDGKMLQFEGGLSITALIINGIFKASKVHNKPTPITADQAVKFATYFLSRRSVQSGKGAHVLLEVLRTLNSDKKIAPICLQLIGNSQLDSGAPVLNIKAVDLLGKALQPTLSSVSARIVVKKDNSVLAEKVQLTAKSSDKTVYSSSLESYKPTRGIYNAEITADKYTQILTFKVLGLVRVHSLEVGVGDSDASSAIKKQIVSYPNKLAEVLNADHNQKLVLKVGLIEESSSKTIAVHQAFVRLVNVKTDEEIIYVAEQDNTKAYKFDMDVGSRGIDFGYKSGLYKMELIIGDASISNSFQWHVANVQLQFLPYDSKTDLPKPKTLLPEIVHKFREPEIRPARFVSDVFTGLSITPLVLLIIFWMKIGINVKNFSFNLSAIGFHLGFAAILGLFGIFWLSLNMFETFRYLIPIAIFTFLCGNRFLRSIANKQK